MSSKACSKCGKPVGPGAKFCPECGAALNKPSGGGISKGVTIAIVAACIVIPASGYFLFLLPESYPGEPTQVDSNQSHDGMDMGNQMPEFPIDYDGLVAIGNNLMDNGQFAMAAEAYRRAMAIDSSQLNVAVDFGACLHGMGLAERAAQEFGKVLAKNPLHAIANFNMGIALSSSGKMDSAKVHWKIYVELQPVGDMADVARKYISEY